MIYSYTYFDINVNVGVMAKELADALDKAARDNGAQGTPGAHYRHERDPKGDWDMTVCMYSNSAFADAMLMLPVACYNLAKACGVATQEQWHHNAGVDARESLASVLAMMFAYPGVRKPEANPYMPILAAVDL